MPLQLGDTAPNFSQKSSKGYINFYVWSDEFQKCNAKTIALSVDGVESHQGWIRDINETQHTSVNYPILADDDNQMANLYGMLHPESSTGNTLTVRSVFIVDPNKKIRSIITYPASTGCNFNEILRVIDSLQLTDYHKVATPGNWQEGDDCVVVPSISTEEAKQKFPKGITEVKPYLRMTPQPN